MSQPPSFGLQIPSFSFASRQGENIFDVGCEIARAAEATGFESVWLMDHLWQMPPVAPESEPLLECFTTLSALAVCTERVALGTLVAAVGFRAPSLLAKITSTLDVISHGRLIVGLGAGWCDWEHESYGLGFPPVRERLARLEDTIEILLAMWSEERATVKGHTFSIEGAVNQPKPLQRPHPPLLIGGSGAKVTLRLTAQYAQLHNLGSGLPDECAAVLAILREHCERLGRDYDAIRKTRLTPIVFGRNEAEAQRRADALQAVGDNRDGYRERTIVGTPEAVAAQLRAFMDAGVESFIVSFADVDEMDPLHILMEEVAPQLA